MTLPITPEEMQRAARERLSDVAYNYYAAGSFGEFSVAENIAAWSRWYIRPRIGVDVSAIDLSTTVLGTAIDLPVMLAPCGFNQLAHPDGEAAVARACRDAGTIQVLSSATNVHPAEIAAAAEAPKWFQLYCDPDPGVTDERVARAVDAGYRAVAITVDTPALGIRYQGLGDVDGFVRELASHGIQPVLNFTHQLSWNELERIASSIPIPVVLKGVLHPDDAARAPDHGASGVIVSNHGGRQLDGSLPPVMALPDVVEAVDGRIEVYVDGGVRTGVDVLRALALGARAVLVGRPYLWALAIDGQAGVAELLERFRLELTNAMALAGQTGVTAVDPSIVVRA